MSNKINDQLREEFMNNLKTFLGCPHCEKQYFDTDTLYCTRCKLPECRTMYEDNDGCIVHDYELEERYQEFLNRRGEA